MMHKFTRLAISAIFVSALNACMTRGGSFDPPKVDLLRPGVSTKEPHAAPLHVGEMVMLIGPVKVAQAWADRQGSKNAKC